MDGKKILAIDTSEKVCSVAISNNNKVVASKSIGNKLSHSENLMPLIESAFLDVDFSIVDIDYIFVVDGPGSFTGIRIGIATAKALAQFKDIPIVTVKSLKVISKLVELPVDGIIVPLIDARRMTFYTMFIKNQECLSDIMHIEFSEICKLLETYNSKVYFLGDNISSILNDVNISFEHEIIDTKDELDRAKVILENSNKFFNNEVLKNYRTAEPFYLKKSQAEREYDEKHGVK